MLPIFDQNICINHPLDRFINVEEIYEGYEGKE